jgi:hypothetical protein
MPESIQGLAYYPITFDENATTQDTGPLTTALSAGGIDDVFILAHGWNATPASADNLYQQMFGHLAAQLGPRLDRTAAVGVFWPAVVFPEDDPSTQAGQSNTPASGQQLADTLKQVFPTHTDDLDRIGRLLDEQPHDLAALEQFRTLTAGLIPDQNTTDNDTGEPATFTDDPVSLFGLYSAMTNQHPHSTVAPQALFDPFPTLWGWGRDVLRIMSYYQIKARAGVIGQTGLGPLIAALPTHPRVHLMGHSFGARLVSFALRPQLPGPASPVKSLLLIQGAFSHFSFALADCRDRVDGPYLATYSAADRALAWWYPAATYLAHHNDATRAELTYQWGALGHDGYQQAGAIDTPILDLASRYQFANDQFYRLNANAVICADQSPLFGAHSDIRHPEILWAAINAAGLA